MPTGTPNTVATGVTNDTPIVLRSSDFIPPAIHWIWLQELTANRMVLCRSFLSCLTDEKVDRTAANFHLWNWWGHREKRVPDAAIRIYVDKYFGLTAVRTAAWNGELQSSH
jgi:hypothetical protein